MIANPEIAQKISKIDIFSATTSSKGHYEFYYTNITLLGRRYNILCNVLVMINFRIPIK